MPREGNCDPDGLIRDKMTLARPIVERSPKRTPFQPDAKPRLKQIDIELTERCNNNCVHCLINRPSDDAEARSREMTDSQIRRILRQAADLGCLQVRFTGGEPLLRRGFEDLYLYARRLGLKVSLFTNARLVTPDLARLFARIPLLVPVEITIYGMSRETCEAVTRSQGAHEQSRRGLERLLDQGVPLAVRWVMLPQNKHETPEFEAWARSLSGTASPPSFVVSLDLRSRRDDAERNDVIRALRFPPQEALAFLSRDAERYRRDMAAFASTFMGPAGDRLFGCGAGRSICVDAYGRVQPCMGLRVPELAVALSPEGPSDSDGSPAAGSGGEDGGVTLSEAMIRYRGLTERRAENPDYLKRCARCFLKGFCEQCPAKSWAEHGTLDTPVAYLCETAHLQARHLGWLKEDEFGWEVADWQARISRTPEERTTRDSG